MAENPTSTSVSFINELDHPVTVSFVYGESLPPFTLEPGAEQSVTIPQDMPELSGSFDHGEFVVVAGDTVTFKIVAQKS